MTRYLVFFAVLLLLSGGGTFRASVRQTSGAGIDLLLIRVEEALEAGDTTVYLPLVTAGLRDDAAESFERLVAPDITRATLRERDRTPTDDGFRLLVEALLERGPSGRVLVWQMDVVPHPDGAPPGWQIRALEAMSAVDGLFRLALNATKQIDARDLVVTANDLTLRIPHARLFVAEADTEVTALVVRGRGEMRFAPAPAAERGQLRLFSGSDTLVEQFDDLFLRINPAEFKSRLAASNMVERVPSASDLRRAQATFADFVEKTFSLQLGDLSRESWSLTPTYGDFVAEIRTRRRGVLTYARALSEPEDISLFDRARRRNLSIYASPEKLATRGESYNEDDLVDYDVLDYNVDASFRPDQEWIDGRTTVRLRGRSYAISTLTLKLAETLTARGVASPEFGRLLHLRVVGQNSLLVSLPRPISRDEELTLTITYSGRVEAQRFDREAIDLREQEQEAPTLIPEPRFIYSNRSYWYPQSQVSDYATATLRLTVPADYACLASGISQGMRRLPEAVTTAGLLPERRQYVFTTERPVRYLGVLISRMEAVAHAEVRLDVGNGAPGGLSVSIHANPRQQARGRSMSERTADILRFYASLMGGAPYPSFSLALTEGVLPGGHSPAYFAVLTQPLPIAQFSWRDDPVHFDNYPPFFLAHELAHQWWGQGVGWKNYHEQWLSEGFAQYFAALYAAHDRNDDVFESLLGQMRDSVVANIGQGPIYLGYRLGHVKGRSRVFRALVYNKAALVLHMLRRMLGDAAFFAGVKRFYTEHQFQKAGTDDLRAAMESTSGRSLERFFRRWIYDDALPVITVGHSVSRDADGRLEAVLRFTQSGDPFDIPLTVTLMPKSGGRREIVVVLRDRVTEERVALDGPLRRVEVNRDNAALARIQGR